MSWLSKGLKAIGGVAEKVAPYVGMIPGVGTIAGGAIGGLGALAHGDGLSGALKYGAQGATGGLTGGGLSGGLKAIGSQVLGNVLHPSQPMDEQPDVIQTGTYYNPDGSIKAQIPIGQTPNAVPAAAPASGGGWKDLLGQGLKFIGNHGDQILGGASLYEGYKQNQKANDLRNQGLGMLTNSYNERAGLRKLGVQGMMNEQAPDLSDVFSPAAANPYSRFRKVS